MANHSETTVVMHGTKENIQKVYDVIIGLAQMCGEKVLDKLANNEDIHINPLDHYEDKVEGNGYSYFCIESLKKDDETIEIEGESKWNGPYDFFKDLFAEYRLTGKYFDAQMGDDFAYLINYANGELMVKTKDKYFSKISVDEFGIEYFYDHFDAEFIDCVNWREDKKHIVAKFLSFGESMEDVESAYEYITIEQSKRQEKIA